LAWAQVMNYWEWPDRLDPLSPETAKQAIARLCYDAAISSKTDFGCNEFGEDCYSAEDWFNFIRTELDAPSPRPVIFSIFVPNNGGGHETVIDGYQEGLTDKVHINFGWNGSQDYYDIMRDFTAGSYTWSGSDQFIAVGTEPDFTQAAVDTDNDTILDVNNNCPDRGTCTSGKIDAICSENSDCGLL